MERLPIQGPQLDRDLFNKDFDVAEGVVDYSNFAYDRMTPEDVTTITDDMLRRVDAHVEQIVTSEDLTWSTIMSPLNEMDDLEAQARGRALFMSNVHPDEAVRNSADEAKTKVSNHSNELWYREDLYQKIKAYSETAEAQALEGEEARSLTNTMRALRRLGHELNPDARARMQELNLQLADNSMAFSRNLRDCKDEVIATAEELDGMTQKYIDGLAQDDDGNYRITMKYPHTLPVLSQSPNRNLRRKVATASNSRVIDVNRPILEDTLRKRQEIASIMGYDSWAHYKLEERMAKSPANVKDFYNELIPILKTKGEGEMAVLGEMLHADGHDDVVRSYDKAYYDARLRERDHGVNDDKVAEYFSLDTTVQGLFQITGETFGLSYRQLDIPTWHEDVLAFAIDDAETGEQISTFYMDLFPREGKFGHAAAFSLQPGREMPDGDYRQPASAIVANFTKPSEDEPSLLQHKEVTTLFHEFGHILHQTLTRARLVGLAGTRVERDFVEAPSQIMEHWTKDAGTLQKFAKHYQTGEPLPPELIEGIVASQQLNIGINNLRQVSFGYADMALHDETPVKDLDQVVRHSSELSLSPHEEGTFFLATFDHIMGGYDAGYYGYLWSEVFGDDMFSRFKQEGITNPAVGRDYRRKILERGGTVDAMDMLRDFLGREPNNKAFLENQGVQS